MLPIDERLSEYTSDGVEIISFKDGIQFSEIIIPEQPYFTVLKLAELTLSINDNYDEIKHNKLKKYLR